MRFSILLFLVAALGCSPCKKLAEKICDCHQSQNQRTECKKNLDQQAQHKNFENAENSSRCEELLKDPDCNCQAVLSGEIEKCGLTRKK